MNGWPPRYVHELPSNADTSEADKIIEWAEANVKAVGDSKASDAGELIKFRPWQVELIRYLCAKDESGRYQWLETVVMLPRGQGKTSVLAVIILYEWVFGPPDAQIVIAAKQIEQGKKLLRIVERMIEQNEELIKLHHRRRETVENKVTKTTVQVVSRDADTLDGSTIHLFVMDEMWNQTDSELWDSGIKGAKKAKNGRACGISTAGPRTDHYGNDRLLFTKFQTGVRVSQDAAMAPTYGFVCWQAPENLAWDSVEAWHAAMPGLNDFIDEDDIRSEIQNGGAKSLVEMKWLNRFVAGENAAFREGAFEKCGLELPGSVPPDGTQIVLGVDGSNTRDCTGIVGCTMEGHLFVVHLQAKKFTDEEDWEVSYIALASAIREACQRWKVREVAFDMKFLGPTMESLADDGIPVVSYPQSLERTVPAWERFRNAVYKGELTHSADPNLEQHARNVVVKQVANGEIFQKETKNSLRKIDLIACSVMAYERSFFYRNRGYDSTLMYGGFLDMD